MIHDDYKVVTMQHPDPKLNKAINLMLSACSTTQLLILQYICTHLRMYIPFGLCCRHFVSGQGISARLIITAISFQQCPIKHF